MLLRRISQHVKDQNWTAIAIDFVIVVVGVFVGIQVSNWNDGRLADQRERASLEKLHEEFSEINRSLKLQINHRGQWIERLARLIETLEGAEPPASDLEIREALTISMATGRRPAESATYLQMTASGELVSLSNRELQQLLVRYHSRLQRDAYIHPELLRQVMDHMTGNPHIRFSFTDLDMAGAAVDSGPEGSRLNRVDRVESYDLDGLREFETMYEAMYLAHTTLNHSDAGQLDIVDDILGQLNIELESDARPGP